MKRMNRMNKRAMLCPLCERLIAVRAIDETSVHLLCGHSRTKGLLPTKGVSIETLNTPDGLRLFPLDVKAGTR